MTQPQTKQRFFNTGHSSNNAMIINDRAKNTLFAQVLKLSAFMIPLTVFVAFMTLGVATSNALSLKNESKNDAFVMISRDEPTAVEFLQKIMATEQFRINPGNIGRSIKEGVKKLVEDRTISGAQNAAMVELTRASTMNNAIRGALLKNEVPSGQMMMLRKGVFKGPMQKLARSQKGVKWLEKLDGANAFLLSHDDLKAKIPTAISGNVFVVMMERYEDGKTYRILMAEMVGVNDEIIYDGFGITSKESPRAPVKTIAIPQALIAQ